MGRKKAFRPTAPPFVTVVQNYVEKRLADMAGYFTGALEQLMLQQGQEMTLQAAVIQYLNEQLAPGAEAAIKSIVEQNIAKAKAEREAREKALAEEAAARADDPVKYAEYKRGIFNKPETAECPTCKLQDATWVSPSGGFYCCRCGEGFGKTEEAPADIAPVAPADAPADSPGDA